LRIIAENIYDYKPREGMDPTRAFLDSILKYKTIYTADSQSPDRHFLYESQQTCLDFLHPQDARDGTELSKLQSIECQIMEWADDIAYSIDDIKDGVDARFITVPKIKRWVTDRSEQLSKAAQKALAQLHEAIESGCHEPHLSKRTAALVTGCRLRKRSTFMDGLTNRYRYLLERDPLVEEERKAYKVLAQELVFSTSSIHQLEHKGGVLLTRMFRSLDHNYEDPKPKHLLPEEWHDQLCSRAVDAHSRKRTICDFLAGMTDAFAVRMYGRLFEPEYGSLTDLA
jgi:dGTPase